MPTLAHPLPGSVVTTQYGAPDAIRGLPHTGTDFAYSGSSCGRRVLAAADGIARRGTNGGGGRGVLIDHGGQIETGYWHLAAQLVADGQRVRQGQQIGTVGSSGTVTGCHLHFEVKVGGRNIDPLPTLSGVTINAPDDQPAAFPLDEGQSCPAGYQRGSVNPQAWGWFPGSPWWNRPTLPDGTVLACVRAGVQPGDNAVATDIGRGVTEAIAGALPVLVNIGAIGLALVVGWAGVKQTLGVK
jgi:hypothetical protein